MGRCRFSRLSRHVMLVSQSNLCIPYDKHYNCEYRQMKEVRSESQMERQGEKTETSELEMEKFDSMLYPRAN